MILTIVILIMFVFNVLPIFLINFKKRDMNYVSSTKIIPQYVRYVRYIKHTLYHRPKYMYNPKIYPKNNKNISNYL